MLDKVGEIVIRTGDGRELRLEFYWAGKNPAVLTADGEDQFWGKVEGYEGDGAIGLGKAIREAYKAAKP